MGGAGGRSRGGGGGAQEGATRVSAQTTQERQPGARRPGLGSTEGPSLPEQVVALDPDLGENGTLVYRIQPPNKFYTLNSSTGKIRTTHVMLDRENPDPHEAELMRKIIISVTDCMCPLQPHAT